ncbi:TCP-1 chaperonin subunit gamma [Spironucleus salmonicida]|uniref:T-complex protein 1 subunit gamma n=1 Tax=Spironucleus salmonicida TaxID=348837 RepID=V6LBA5_9EUKA|nr:TCP-1 chaperonin subunit gamma [Spironucleus salmonicida]|eukprot:EST41533.1 TCP-1 chaperonin subunit gamma [Spironucleus salmonicida]
MQPEVFVINENSKRERGDTARQNNIKASTTVADIIRSTLGPRSMLKMILDPAGGIVMTNDGNAILREVDVAHPAAKSMIELARGQDEQCGDGSTGVVVLTGEIIASCEKLVKQMHPIVLTQNLQECLEFINTQISGKEVENSKENAIQVINNCLNTKFSSNWGDLIVNMAFQAVKIVQNQMKFCDATDIDIKRFARVEKIPGGAVDDCQIIRGCVLNKDIIHPSMPKSLQNPRILLLDATLEYKKANSMLNVELQDKASLTALLNVENDFLNDCVDKIVKFNPNIVITEKGVSDIVAQRFADLNIVCLRRVRKTDNVRLAAATGARIVNRLDDIRAGDIGNAGVYELQKFGDEFFVFVHECDEKCAACTLLLRGASKDALLEVERNLQDALHVARNFFLAPNVAVGGGAFEMQISALLNIESLKRTGNDAMVFQSVSRAFEVIPRTLLMNCGGNVIREITKLRGLQSQGQAQMGVNGETGEIVDCFGAYRIWDLYETKIQMVRTAFEQACMIMRVDDLFNAKMDRQ